MCKQKKTTHAHKTRRTHVDSTNIMQYINVQYLYMQTICDCQPHPTTGETTNHALVLNQECETAETNLYITQDNSQEKYFFIQTQKCLNLNQSIQIIEHQNSIYFNYFTVKQFLDFNPPPKKRQKKSSESCLENCLI